MKIEEAIEILKDGELNPCVTEDRECCDMAIRALEMQKKLAEFNGADICYWDEDYDFEENDISEYEYETSVDNFLIDEAKEEESKNDL